MKQKRQILIVFILLAVISAMLAGCRPASAGASASTEPTAIPEAYIQNKGSDTIVNLALAWAERYQQVHPEVRLSVTGGGSGTGLASLINGTVDIANASRAIKQEEIDEARANGIEPVETVIARDAIAVIVNPGNPIDHLTLEQVAQIYIGEINNWSELGGEDRPIVRLSRETNSGTHVYFLEEVIRLGDKKNKSIFSANTLLLPSSEGIISEVRDNPNAIGYDGLGYVTDEVKVLGIAREKGGDYILPSIETVNADTYPIARDLYMYSRSDAKQPVLDYLAWLLLPEAQQIVGELGFVPVKVLATSSGRP